MTKQESIWAPTRAIWTPTRRQFITGGAALAAYAALRRPRRAEASLVASLLTVGADNSGGSPISTASVTPSANALVLFFLVEGIAGAVLNNTNGLTWTQIVTDLSDGSARRASLWRGMTGSPSAGTMSFTNPGSATVCWIVIQITGCDTSGTNGSGAILQGPFTAADGSHTISTIDSPLGVASQSGNMIVGLGEGRDETATLAVGSGYTALALNNTAFLSATVAEYITGVTQTACGYTMTAGGPNNMAMISLEVQPPAAGGTSKRHRSNSY